MDSSLGIAIVTLASFLGLVLMVQASIKWDRPRMGPGGWYLLFAVWSQCLPFLVAHLEGGRVPARDYFGNLYIALSSNVILLQTVLRYVTIAVGIAVFVYWALARRGRISPAGILALGVIIVAMLPTIVGSDTNALASKMALAALVLGASAIPVNARSLRGFALGGLSVGFTAALLALIAPESSLGVCRDDKCGVFGFLMYGPTNNENALAMLLAVAMPATWLAFHGPTRLYLTTFLLFIVYVSSSRSSLLAAAAVMLVAVIARPAIGKLISPPLRVILHVTTGALLLAATVTPLLPWPPDAFTKRAYLWQLAGLQIQENWLAGLGADRWAQNIGIGLIGSFSNYSTHNQILDIVYVSGLLGLSLFVGLIIAVWVRRNPNAFALTSFILLPYAALAILERPLGFTSLDFFAWSLPALIVCSGAVSVSNSDFATGPVTSSGFADATTRRSRTRARQ